MGQRGSPRSGLGEESVVLTAVPVVSQVVAWQVGVIPRVVILAGGPTVCVETVTYTDGVKGIRGVTGD